MIAVVHVEFILNSGKIGQAVVSVDEFKNAPKLHETYVVEHNRYFVSWILMYHDRSNTTSDSENELCRKTF